MPAVVFKKRMTTSQGGGARRKKPVIIGDHERSDGDSSDSDETTEIRQIKRSKTLGITSTEKMTKNDFQTVESKSLSNVVDQDDATKENLFYKMEREAALKTIEERKKISETAADKNDHIYRGEAGYKKYIDGSTDGKPKFGPIKAATNVRSTTAVDYQPDVCKDYKLTGYCGYGDSCKFLHSREDYQAGWLLDKEWEKVKKNGVKKDSADENEQKTPEIPFKCVICKNDYTSPVVTLCKHYFCEECFLTEYRKQPACFVCNKATGGIIQPAKEVLKLINEKKEKEKTRNA